MQTCVTLEFVFTVEKSGLYARETNSDHVNSEQAIPDQVGEDKTASPDQVGEDKMA